MRMTMNGKCSQRFRDLVRGRLISVSYIYILHLHLQWIGDDGGEYTTTLATLQRRWIEADDDVDDVNDEMTMIVTTELSTTATTTASRLHMYLSDFDYIRRSIATMSRQGWWWWWRYVRRWYYVDHEYDDDNTSNQGSIWRGFRINLPSSLHCDPHISQNPSAGCLRARAYSWIIFHESNTIENDDDEYFIWPLRSECPVPHCFNQSHWYSKCLFAEVVADRLMLVFSLAQQDFVEIMKYRKFRQCWKMSEHTSPNYVHNSISEFRSILKCKKQNGVNF